MTRAIVTLALALVLGACGSGSSQSPCEKLMKHAMSCRGELANERIADEEIAAECKDKDIAAEADALAACADETDCLPLAQCAEKLEPGLDLLGK